MGAFQMKRKLNRIKRPELNKNEERILKIMAIAKKVVIKEDEKLLKILSNY